MARMIPGYCPDGAPPGEKAIFAALAAAPETSDWIVLHSLPIADHVRQAEGEADFIVIVPGKGILVIEAKSHGRVGRLNDGRWQLGSGQPTTRGPFQQASEAMHSIRKYLERKKVDLRSIPVCDAVWFTAVRARTELPASPEWHAWQVLDSEDLRASAVRAVLRTLAAGADHLNEKYPGFTYGGVPLDRQDAERIAAALRPRVEMAVAPGDQRRNSAAQLLALLDEQYDALDTMQDNRAALFTGPAGSGKTLLALEAARREASAGRAGRLLCFNAFLGRQLAADAEGIPGLRVATLHQELLLIASTTVPKDADEDFWERELPDRALEALLDDQAGQAGDFLIVDEVQDITSPAYLDVLGLLVTGGLEKGRVLLFGDFERQAIFKSADGLELLRAAIPGLASHRLTYNCRNLPRIGYAVNAFSKLQPGYKNFRRDDDGFAPVTVAYTSGEDQSRQLVKCVRDLQAEGFALNEITVLSPVRSGSVAETTADPWLRQVLRKAGGQAARPGQLRYCTIAQFKGLESRAVVLTDLDQRLVPNFEALLYVGLTRATDRLVALIEKETFRVALGVGK
jgi:hypothetical protein